MSKRYCPACGDEVFSASGRSDARFLAVEEYPYMSFTSTMQGNDIPPSKIFRRELAKAGLTIHEFQVMPFYPHLLGDSEMNEACLEVGIGIFDSLDISKFEGILVFGNYLCNLFTDYKLDEIVGLTGVPNRIRKDIPVMFLPSIKTVYSQGAGELQLGLKRFAKLVGVE